MNLINTTIETIETIETIKTHESHFSGTDAKILQYDIKTIPEQIKKKYGSRLSQTNVNYCHDPFSITDEISKLFNKPVKQNYLLINIEKDLERYQTTLDEFKKLYITNFCHLKATNWKNREQLVDDLNYVINFLKQFNDNNDKIKTNSITINHFSEPSDKNIYIQDGPLACYVSHLRAMIYGYTHFEDYTVIIEDDIDVVNTGLIKEHLCNVPNDWDIILFNCSRKNVDTSIGSTGKSKLYKLTGEFHSTHFYIIKNSSMPKIFSKLYPVNDQVDVLLSDCFKEFNYYNIEACVMQKYLSTSTQNNLYVVYNSPHYNVIRDHIATIKSMFNEYLDKKFPHNPHNQNLAVTMLFDLVYTHMGHKNSNWDNYNMPVVNHKDYIDSDPFFTQLIDKIVYFLYCTEKGVNVSTHAYSIVSMVIDIVNNFIEKKENYNVMAYGSTCFVFNKDNLVIKKYGNFLRWKTKDHEEILQIFSNELECLKKLNMLEFYSEINKTLILPNYGVSLFDYFELSHNWKQQIIKQFEIFNNCGIVYNEFNLKNIIVKNGEIKFVDFGLAKLNCLDTPNENNLNCSIFIELLQLLDDRLKSEPDNEKRLVLCKILVDNIKLHKVEKYLRCVY